MQNPELKNIFIAAGIAVFAGVISLGANAVFGVAPPSVQPSDAGNIGPTFSTVKTTGDAEIQGNLKDTADGRVDVSGNLFVTEYVSSGDLIASDDITVYGSIQDPMDTIINIVGNLLSTGYISGTDLFASDDVIVSGDLDIAGDIVDNNGDFIVRVNGPFEATDTVSIGNNTSINGDLNVEDVIQSGTANNSTKDVRISDVLNLIFYEDANGSGSGSFKINYSDGTRYLTMDNNEIITVGDDFHMNVEGSGNVKIGKTSDSSNLYVYGNVDVGDSSILNKILMIYGNADVWGSIKNTGMNPAVPPIAGPTPKPVVIDDNLSVTGLADISGQTHIYDNLTVDGYLYGPTSITTSGYVRASRFGTYTRRISGATTVAPSTLGTASQACTGSEYLISCGFTTSGTSIYPTDIYMTGSALGSTCYVNGKNSSVSLSESLYSYAYCLNPSS